MQKIWIENPHSGGIKIPPEVQISLRKRLEDHITKNYASKKIISLDLKFRGALCYVNVFQEPSRFFLQPQSFDSMSRDEYHEQLRKTPVHLGRLRYFDNDTWTFAFFTSSTEKFQPAVFHNGDEFGTPEEAFDICSMFLD
jgi:hypothetical protein